MENNEKILCKADIREKLNIIIGALIIIIPLIVEIIFNRKYMWDNAPKKGLFSYTSAHQTKYYMFFGYSDESTKYVMYNLIFIVLLAVVAFIILKVVSVPSQRATSLTLTENQVYGQVKNLFGTKKLQMPIEKLDNVMTASGPMDKLRGGETLVIHSNSGAINFHYVYNAEEFAAAAMKRIDEVKKSAPTAAAPTPAPVQNVTGGDAMEKINSLKQMLDNGLITQEQFEQKKQEIISKM